MDTVKAMVAAGFWAEARDAVRTSARQRTISRDLLFIVEPLCIARPPEGGIDIPEDINKFMGNIKTVAVRITEGKE